MCGMREGSGVGASFVVRFQGTMRTPVADGDASVGRTGSAQELAMVWWSGVIHWQMPGAWRSRDGGITGLAAVVGVWAWWACGLPMGGVLLSGVWRLASGVCCSRSLLHAKPAASSWTGVQYGG